MAKRNYLKIHSSARAVKTKRLLIAGAVLFSISALWKFVVGEMGVVKYYRMSAHARELRNEIGHPKKDNARLSKEVTALKTAERLATCQSSR